MKIEVITTFAPHHFRQHAQRCLESFTDRWVRTSNMTVYVEDRPDSYPRYPRVKYKNIHRVDPEVQKFIDRYPENRVKHLPLIKEQKEPNGFRLDAKRFSFKVFALCHAAHADRAEHPDLYVWMDADVFTHSHVSEPYLRRLHPKDMYLSYIGREGRPSETGYFSLNPNGFPDAHRHFLSTYYHYYVMDRVYTLQEWHDAYVFDHVRGKIPFPSRDLAAGLPRVVGGHPFVETELGETMDHLKGENRKRRGRSDPRRLILNRREEYWR